MLLLDPDVGNGKLAGDLVEGGLDLFAILWVKIDQSVKLILKTTIVTSHHMQG